MNIIIIFVSVILLITSFWLFYVAKSKIKKVVFIHEDSEKSWKVFKTNFWMISKTYIQENVTAILITSIFASVLIILGAYYFYGESALINTLLIVLGFWGAIGTSLLVGSNASSDGEIPPGTEDIFKVIKETVKNIKKTIVKNKDESIVYSGYVELPSKIYVNESANIIVNLFCEVLPTKSNREHMETVQNKELKLIDIYLQRKQSGLESLKVELQAASLKIAVETNQQIDLINNHIKFQWSITSENPTLHKINLIFLKVSNSLIKHLGEIEHSVKVVNLLGLTRRQVFVAAGISGLLGVISAMEKILEFLSYISRN
ncbi:MAG: hypothetical protein M3Q99_09605 [Acidobacteriota bacterium]|nr:hypothetical protein [Acidobacteriota bacterium]